MKTLNFFKTLNNKIKYYDNITTSYNPFAKTKEFFIIWVENGENNTCKK